MKYVKQNRNGWQENCEKKRIGGRSSSVPALAGSSGRDRGRFAAGSEPSRLFHTILLTGPVSRRGQSLVEVLLALGVFVVSVVTVSLLLTNAFIADRQAVERAQATLLAREGIEAARSIRDADFDNLATGTHGLALISNRWALSGASDTIDQFTRTVEIGSTTIASIDGTDSKAVTSTVTWNFTPARQDSVILVDQLLDWQQTQGHAGEFRSDLDSIFLGAGQKKLEGIIIENASTSPITIDKIAATWGDGRRLTQIRINGTNVYGPDPTGVTSGTEVDISNFTLASSSGAIPIDLFKFDDFMNNAYFNIKFTLTDASTYYALVFPGTVNEASFLDIDTSGASIGGGGNKQLQNINLTNTHPSSTIELDKITPTWNNSELIDEIKIGGSVVWTGSATSGTALDITNVEINKNTTKAVNYLQFTGNMTGATFAIIFTMADGTASTTGNFTP